MMVASLLKSVFIFNSSTLSGNIRYWNDTRVLKDNNAATQAVLHKVSNTNPIHIVVRQDSSGTTDIASQGFAAFSPAQTSATFAGSKFDSSFETSVGGGQTPSWCGSKTDEIQTITIAGCDSSLSATSKQVNLTIVDVNYNVRTFSFLCDASADSFRSSFMSANTGKSVYVSVSQGSSPSFTNVITLGYQGSVGGPKNWYQPYVASAVFGLTVTVNSFQEGGYVNNQYQTKTVLQEIKSLWIAKVVSFNATLWYGPTAINFTSTNGTLTRHANNFPDHWISITRFNHSNWVEYQITFSKPSKNVTHIQVTTPGLSGQLVAFINTLTSANNYPIFYNPKQPFGFSNSGQYTCYKREHNYSAWTYSTGNGNDGVAAEVIIFAYNIFCSNNLCTCIGNRLKILLILLDIQCWTMPSLSI